MTTNNSGLPPWTEKQWESLFIFSYLFTFGNNQNQKQQKKSSFSQQIGHTGSLPQQTPPQVCSICLEDSTDCQLNPCSHTFHQTCLLRWCAINPSCPMCRNWVDLFID